MIMNQLQVKVTSLVNDKKLTTFQVVHQLLKLLSTNEKPNGWKDNRGERKKCENVNKKQRMLKFGAMMVSVEIKFLKN